MKKAIKYFSTLALVLLFAGSSFAHPPKWMSLFFSMETKTLYIKIKHEVKDTEKHFVDNIEISVNGEVVKTLKPKNQLSPMFENHMLKLKNVKAGDEITVSANCNKLGKETETIIVQKE